MGESVASIQTQLQKLAEPILASLGYELVEVEYSAGRGTGMVRFFIDAEGGVTVDDCARVSRELDPVLDVEEIVPGTYQLEVSSPGVNRPVRRPEDFERFVGETIKVKTYAKIGDRKVFLGTLLGLDGDEVRLDVEGLGEQRFRLDAIAKANLQRL